ncbi:hypothetical protein M405DRAFT_703260, partial [Rhizopogon salebrosus TDB-379]
PLTSPQTISQRPASVEPQPLAELPITYPDQLSLLAEVKGNYKMDPFFKTILDSPKSYQNFEEHKGYIRLRLKDRTPLCIPDILVEGRKLRERLIDQAHSLLAHLGARKTLSYLREYVWWKT